MEILSPTSSSSSASNPRIFTYCDELYNSISLLFVIVVVDDDDDDDDDVVVIPDDDDGTFSNDTGADD